MAFNEKLFWKDFRYFLYHMWKFLNLPEPTKVQYEIAEWFQYCTIGGGHKRSITCAFRGVGKSWIRTAGTLWLAGQNPNWKFMLPSASGGKASDFTRFTRTIMDQWDPLKFLRPNPMKNQRDTITSFDFGPCTPAQQPSVSSIGISGQMAGSRSNFIFPDDVEIPSNSYTEMLREQLLHKWVEFDSILSPGGVIHAQGTPQTEESLYLRLAKDQGYSIRFWPAEVPSDKELGPYLGNLAPSINMRVLQGHSGQATDPKRFNEQELILKRSSAGMSHYRLHFMLDTSLSDKDRYPLKTSDLIVMPLRKWDAPISITWGTGPLSRLKELQNFGFCGDHFNLPSTVDQTWKKFDGVKLFIDPAGMGGDEVAYCVIGALNGNLFVPTYGGLKNGYSPANLETLAHIAWTYKVQEIHVEDNMGDGMFRALLSPIVLRKHRCHIEGFKVNVQKEIRIISTLEPVLNSHRLIVDYDAIATDIKEARESEDVTKSLMYQLTHVTKQKRALRYDDRLDVLSAGVRHWIDFLQIDNEKALKDQAAIFMDEEISRFMEGAVPVFPDGRSLLGEASRVTGYCDHNDPFKRRNTWSN